MVRIPSHDNQRSAEACIIRTSVLEPCASSYRFIPFRFAKGQWYNASSCCTLLHTAACHAEARLLIFRYAAGRRIPPFREDTPFFSNSDLEIFSIFSSNVNIFPDSYVFDSYRIELSKLFAQIHTARYVNRTK